MKKILILIFLLIASLSQAQVRRGSFLTISDLDSFQLGGRYFNIASFNDSTEERSNVFTRDNTFNGSVDLNGFTTVYGQIEFNNLITAKDTLYISNPNNTGYMRTFIANSDSVLRIEGDVNRIMESYTITGLVNSSDAWLINNTVTPAPNRTSFNSYSYQGTMNASANGQEMVMFRIRPTAWVDGGFTSIQHTAFKIQQAAGGVGTFNIFEDQYTATMLLDRVNNSTHLFDAAGRFTICQDGGDKNLLSFVYDGNPANGATYDSTDVIDVTMLKSPFKTLFFTGALGMYANYDRNISAIQNITVSDSSLNFIGTNIVRTNFASSLGAVTFNSGVAITTTTGAFTVPRMDSTQRDALTPVAGDIIFNTTTNKHQGYDGTIWNDFY